VEEDKESEVEDDDEEEAEEDGIRIGTKPGMDDSAAAAADIVGSAVSEAEVCAASHSGDCTNLTYAFSMRTMSWAAGCFIFAAKSA
jgi:hypothetical protein